MGYGTRSAGACGEIRTFWPDDTDTEIYIVSDTNTSLSEIQTIIDGRWPGASSNNILIRSQKIHTDCLGYDLYDASDYTDFIIIERLKGA